MRGGKNVKWDGFLKTSRIIIFRTVCIVFLLFGIEGCGKDDLTDGSNSDFQEIDSGRDLARSSAEAGAKVNQAPVIEELTIRPEFPRAGRVVQVVDSTTDPDGDMTRTTFKWYNEKGEVISKGRTLDTSFLSEGDQIEIVARATDGKIESDPVKRKFQLVSEEVKISTVAIDTSEGTKPGTILKAIVETKSGVGFVDFEYEWLVNDEVMGTGETLDTKVFAAGDIVKLRASIDGEEAGRKVLSQPLGLSLAAPPEILSQPRGGIEGGVFRYQIRARSDEEIATLNYELLKGPDGMSVNEKSGLVLWRPKNDQLGEFQIEVAVKDQWESGSAQSFSIKVDPPEAPPASPR